MFDLYCHICQAAHVVDSAAILSTHRTSEGAIAYVRCPQGHTLAVDFDRLNPYSWRAGKKSVGGDGPPARPIAA